MAIERDLKGYGRARPNIVWPNGARVAIALSLNFEEGVDSRSNPGYRRNNLARRLRSSDQGSVISCKSRLSTTVCAWRCGAFSTPWSAAACPSHCKCAAALSSGCRTWRAWRCKQVTSRSHMAGAGSRIPGIRTKRSNDRTLYVPVNLSRRPALNPSAFSPVAARARGRETSFRSSALCTISSNALNDDLPYWDTASGRRALLIVPYCFDQPHAVSVSRTALSDRMISPPTVSPP